MSGAADPLPASGKLTAVLLPGLDGTGDLLRDFAAAAPVGFNPRIIGFPADRVLTHEELREFVLERIPAGERLIIIAESFSGPLALRLAGLRPRGLVAVVLCNSFARSPVSSPWRWLPWSLFLRFRPPRRLLRRYLLGPKANPATVEEVRATIRKVVRQVLVARIKTVFYTDVMRELVSCPVPILYLRGDEDAVIQQSTVEELKSARPDMLVETLHAPHLLFQSIPEAAWERIGAFVQRFRNEGG